MNTRVCIFSSIIGFYVLLNALYASSKDESLVLSCGSDGGEDPDGRKWQSDEHFVTSKESKTTKANYQDPSLLSEVPYMHARFSQKEIVYKFPIKAKTRYWARFHFYPSSYPDVNITNSYFSVIANGITLLNNFSASITAQALTQAYLIKEYSLAPTDKTFMDVSFKPSDKYHGSAAFVNGIELIPIPQLFDSATLVGFSGQSIDAKEANMQTMYRANVAGKFIPPNQDSGGLMRTWYDDLPYVCGAGVGVNQQLDPNTKIDYKKLPHYSAPVDVYNTGRGMGPNKDVNLNFNLTWVFEVDANFTYLVRLHFCELLFTKVNQRVFNIYVNNQPAQADPQPADVIGWTGARGVPIYKDYAVYVEDMSPIWVQMSPSTESKPEYNNAILNGIEIFKMDGTGNLAGPNPNVSDLLAKAEPESRRSFSNNKDKNRSSRVVIGGAAGGAAAVGLVAAICFVVYNKKKRVPGAESQTSSWLPIYGNSQTSTTKSSTVSGKSNANSHLSAMAQGLCRRFSLMEIRQATKSFDDSYVIGVGGFGKVYKGILDGKTKVAIKRSNPSSEQGVNEFVTEIEMLSKLRHKHLVSLIGFCEEGGEMCLVYDYMALGTMREHLYNTKKPHLSWKQRLEICIGAARGLHYLHTGAKYTIIHRDVKTTNILLDDNWVAKVSDFGLSKTGPNMENGHVSTVVKGSFGYLDPEYFKRQQLTEKSDVYSFGVVLFEALCARPALNPSLPKEQVSLADWAVVCKRKGTLHDIIDPNLKGKINEECLKKFADTAEKCLSEHGLERPSMGDVLWNLEFALQLLETDESSSCNSSRRRSGNEKIFSSSSSSYGSDNARARNISSHASLPSVGNDIETPEDVNPSGIFSQIVNPKGR